MSRLSLSMARRKSERNDIDLAFLAGVGREREQLELRRRGIGELQPRAPAAAALPRPIELVFGLYADAARAIRSRGYAAA